MTGKLRPPPPAPPPLCLLNITPVVQTIGLKHNPRTHWRFCRGWSMEQRQVNRHDCLPSLLGEGDKRSEIMYCEKKIFCTRPSRAAKPGQKSLVLSRRAQWTNQPRKNLFHIFSLSPHLTQFQQSAWATPLWSPWNVGPREGMSFYVLFLNA